MTLSITKQNPQTLAVDVPAEPPLGSVVLDALGIAWQSAMSSAGDRQVWSSAGSRSVFAIGGTASGWASWALLITERGPLTLLHRA